MKLRSLLFVPGDKPDLMQKALRSGADALILDLEDSVAPRRKAQARIEIAEFLRRDSRPIPLFVRINPLQSGLTDDDLAAAADAHPDGVMLAKAEGAASILELRRRMTARGMPSLRILPIANETPSAVFRLGEYATVAEHLIGITWGVEDLSTAIGAVSARQPDGRYTEPYEMVRALTLFAAHGAQVPAIDTVYPAFRDPGGLMRHAVRGMRDGFSGMMAIHPSQVSIINAAFSPTAEQVARARRIVAEFSKHLDAGVLNIDGAMIDAPHLKLAQRILALADATGAAIEE